MSAPQKLDLFKAHKSEYVSPKKPTLVELGPARYLAVSGDAPPASEAFQEAIGALYGVAYTVKMTRKAAGLGDYVVCKLEGYYRERGEGGLEWRLMIRVPEVVGAADVASAIDKLIEKGKGEACRSVSLFDFEGGSCVQMLHVGPYEREQETVALMRAHAEEQGWAPGPGQHDVYLSDPRRAEPEKLRTIVRLPLQM